MAPKPEFSANTDGLEAVGASGAVVSAGAVGRAADSEGFWAAYWKSLKPLAVEEPIDVWVHRPLAYVLARMLLPTRITPNQVTMVSIIFGLISGFALFSSFPQHMLVGGLALFLSAIFDCADGQLARMRGTSSALGRMLDGIADLVVSVAAVGGGIWVLISRHHDPLWFGAIVLALCIATAVTGSYHTGTYDHYKNAYLKLTSATFKEGEDYESALERYRQRKSESIFVRLAWPIYLFYVRELCKYAVKFDPWTSARFALYPAYRPEYAAIYEKHCGRLMRIWRSWFGFGSLVFGIALFAAIDQLEVYMVARLVLLNVAYFGYMRGKQREASRAAFAEMGVRMPDQAAA